LVHVFYVDVYISTGAEQGDFDIVEKVEMVSENIKCSIDFDLVVLIF
jgi:hypothetical protein